MGLAENSILIDKPMRAQIAEGNSGTTVQGKAADNLEGKAMMLERLHEDFGGSKIVSIKSCIIHKLIS